MSTRFSNEHPKIYWKLKTGPLAPCLSRRAPLATSRAPPKGLVGHNSYSERGSCLGVVVKMLLVLGVRNPQSTACEVGAFVSRIKRKSLINFLFLRWYCFCIHLYVTICMKLDLDMHIGLHLVLFGKIGVTRRITWRSQVSDPLGKGNSSTHSRQNYAQAKSANYQTKARKPQRAPAAHMQAPPEPMQLPLDECMQPLDENRADALAQLWPVRPVDTTSQTGAQHVNRTSTRLVRLVTSTGQTGAQQSPEMAQNHLKTLYMHSVAQNMLKLLLIDNAWIKPKFQKNAT
jgi:hypothetical protein